MRTIDKNAGHKHCWRCIGAHTLHAGTQGTLTKREVRKVLVCEVPGCKELRVQIRRHEIEHGRTDEHRQALSRVLSRRTRETSIHAWRRKWTEHKRAEHLEQTRNTLREAGLVAQRLSEGAERPAFAGYGLCKVVMQFGSLVMTASLPQPLVITRKPAPPTQPPLAQETMPISTTSVGSYSATMRSEISRQAWDGMLERLAASVESWDDLARGIPGLGRQPISQEEEAAINGGVRSRITKYLWSDRGQTPQEVEQVAIHVEPPDVKMLPLPETSCTCSTTPFPPCSHCTRGSADE